MGMTRLALGLVRSPVHSTTITERMGGAVFLSSFLIWPGYWAKAGSAARSAADRAIDRRATEFRPICFPSNDTCRSRLPESVLSRLGRPLQKECLITRCPGQEAFAPVLAISRREIASCPARPFSNAVLHKENFDGSQRESRRFHAPDRRG